MAGQKLTEKALATQVKSGASVIISQMEQGSDGKEIESIRRLQFSALVSALRSNGINQGYALTDDVMKALEAYVADIEPVEGGIKVTLGDGSDLTIPVAAGGLAFDRIYYDQDTGYLHIYQDDVDVVDPTYIGGGGSGSGGGSKLTFSVYTPASFSVIDSAGAAVITYKFTSLDSDTETPTGTGNLAISVGGIVRTNMVIQQGDNLTVDVFRYLSKGSNSVRLTITDSYGATATRNFTITVESFEVTWSLNDAQMNREANLSFYITPTGNGIKTIYTYLDGKQYAEDIVTTSGRRLTKTISNLAHGAHTIEVYGKMEVSGSELESNHLTAAIAQVLAGSDDPVVAVKWPEGPLTQYTTVNIPYMVVDPTANPATVQFLEGESVVMEREADQTEQIWAYRPLTAGEAKLTIRRGSAESSKEYSVEGLDIEVEEVTDGLELKIDPSTISNLADWSQKGYKFTLSDHFDLVNGGLMTDDKGVHCIRITAGDRLTLSYDPFSTDTIQTGKEIKIVYKIADCSDKRAVIINALSGGKGLEVRANNVYLRGDQNSIELSTCEDEKTELDVNIQKYAAEGDRLMMMMESCSTFSIKQYAQQEDFRHSPSTGIVFGSDDADLYLYLFRAYNRDLTDAEIKANYIVDGADGAEIDARFNRNNVYDGTGNVDIEAFATQNPGCHVVVFSAERMTLGKKDEVPGSIRHIYTAGGPDHEFTAEVLSKVQGTSSVEHAATAGPNINFEFVGGITLASGVNKPEGYAMNGEANSIPTNLITFKKNIASQDHIINRACAHWYNKFQPSLRQARKDDPRVRDCLESTMAAVFFHNTGSTATMVGPDLVQPGETVFFGLGNICSNKDAEEVFKYDDIVIEVLNNTEPQVRFKSRDLTGDNFSNNYEFRYLNKERYQEAQAIAEWQKVQDFIYATDYTAATGAALGSPETIGGTQYTNDTAEYRKAKWKAEAPAIFDMDTLYWHHNITLFFLLRDNRAKNMFWSKSNDTGKWGLWFNWDNDTGLCRNNEGYVDMEPGYMDFDQMGTADVFNGADNALFTNIRECNFNELRASYLDRENAGAWDIDSFYAYCEESQEQICESLWIEDAEHNAIRTLENLGTAAYLERSTGRLRLHIKKALIFQKALIDSYYTATASTADSASFRGYTPQSWAGVQPSGKFTIKPYTNLYINILAGSTSYRVRANEGENVELDISAALNDTEIYVRNAGWIQEMGDLSGLYLGQFEASRLKRVRKLLIGSSVDGYYNTAFTTASFDNCRKLEELNLGGLVNAAQTFDLSNNLYLKTIYTKGSGVSGLRFARNGRLRTAELNALASLYMNGLWLLETLDVASYDNLGTLTIEGCDQIDSLAIVQEAVDKSLSRLRLVGINWTLTEGDILDKLLKVGGLNDAGFSQEMAYITGEVYLPVLRQSQSTAYTEAWPNLHVKYDLFVNQHAVTFLNWDDSFLFREYVDQGGDAYDPVEHGDIPAPTRPRDAQYTYTYKGWDGPLTTVGSPRTLRATYDTEVRTYTVEWRSMGVMVDKKTVEYGAKATTEVIPSYTAQESALVFYVWSGYWDKWTGFVTEDMIVNAVFESHDMGQKITDTEKMGPAYVYGLRQLGRTNIRQELQIKDRLRFNLGYQPEYTNVPHWDATPEMIFKGNNYVETDIDFLKGGIADPWTLVIDFEFTVATNNSTIMSIWQEDGAMGLRIRYASNGPVVAWGANTYNSAMGTNREIMVIRHTAGEQMVRVYSSQTSELTIGIAPILKTIDTITDHKLIFGCAKSDTGEYTDYAQGIVHSCRLWYADLGDSECQKIAIYPREQILPEVSSYAGFTLAGESSQTSEVDFLAANLLSRQRRLNAQNTNEGGFPATEMLQWLRARIYPAFPAPWRALLKKVKVRCTIRVENNVGDIVTEETELYLPAYGEVSSQSADPWISEGNLIPYLTSNNDRLRWRQYAPRKGFQLFTGTTDPTLLESNNVQEGDVWVNSTGYLRVNGEWLAAVYWWLRSAYLTFLYFWFVNSTGASTGGTAATNAYGVALRFSI